MKSPQKEKLEQTLFNLTVADLMEVHIKVDNATKAEIGWVSPIGESWRNL